MTILTHSSVPPPPPPPSKIHLTRREEEEVARSFLSPSDIHLLFNVRRKVRKRRGSFDRIFFFQNSAKTQVRKGVREGGFFPIRLFYF